MKYLFLILLLLIPLGLAIETGEYRGKFSVSSGNTAITIHEKNTCTEDWSCSYYNSCEDGNKEYVCSDCNSCGTNLFQPTNCGESVDCSSNSNSRSRSKVSSNSVIQENNDLESSVEDRGENYSDDETDNLNETYPRTRNSLLAVIIITTFMVISLLIILVIKLRQNY